MSDTKTVERQKRLESLNLVSISHKNPSGEVDLETVGRTLDLSLGGILLEVPVPIPEPHGTIEITIGFKEHVIVAKGRIVHQRQLDGGMTGLGISFTEIPASDRRILSDFLGEE